MKTAKEIFQFTGNKEEEQELFKYGCPFESYTPIIKSFGNVIVRYDEPGYEGFTYVVLENDGKYGYLTFGWGSCEFCDALQACESFDDVQQLIDLLYSQIIWRDTRGELKNYLIHKDWTLCHEWYEGGFKEFFNLMEKSL